MKNRNNRFSEMIVGLFMLGITALLVYFTIVISGMDLIIGHKLVPVNVTFDQVGGLKDRDSVMYRGTKVGTVEDIALAENGINVRLSIDKNVVLRSGYRISVEMTSLLGGNHIKLEEGTGDALPLDTTVFKGETPSDMISELGSAAKKVNDALDVGEIRNIITNVDVAVNNIKIITERVERGEGTVGKLLSPDEKLFDDLSRSVANAREITDRVASGEGLVGKVLSTNDTIYAEFKDTMKGLRDTVDNFKAFSENVNSKDGLAYKITADKSFADRVDKIVADLNGFTEKLSKNEGTIGKLVSDPSLYDEVNGLIKDVRQIVDNYRDTTPITTFGSLATGAL